MSNIGAYSNIAEKYADSATRKISRQIVLDNKDSPKAVGLWGRLVRFLASLGKAPDQRKEFYQAAIENFKVALNDKYKGDALEAAQISLNSVITDNRSLRARDVYDAINAANKSNAAQIQLKQDIARDRQNISVEMAVSLGPEFETPCRNILYSLENPIRTDKGDLDPDEYAALLLCTGRVGAGKTIMTSINASLDKNNVNHENFKFLRDKIDSAFKKMEIHNSDKKKDYYLIAQPINNAPDLQKNKIFTNKGYTVEEVYEYNNDPRIQNDESRAENLIHKYKMYSHSMCHIKQEDGSIKHFLMCKPNLQYQYYSTSDMSGNGSAKCAYFHQLETSIYPTST